MLCVLAMDEFSVLLGLTCMGLMHPVTQYEMKILATFTVHTIICPLPGGYCYQPDVLSCYV